MIQSLLLNQAVQLELVARLRPEALLELGLLRAQAARLKPEALLELEVQPAQAAQQKPEAVLELAVQQNLAARLVQAERLREILFCLE